MRFKLATHFALLTLLVGGVTLYLDPLVGAAYLVGCAAILLPLSGVWRTPTRFFYVVLFTAVAIWLTHLARVPVLLLRPESARFARVVQIGSGLGVRVVLELALYSFLLMLGLVIGFKLFARSDADRARSQPPARPFLVDASVVMALLCVGTLAARIYFQLVLGLNTKNVLNSSLGFLQRLLPDGLIYPIALLYLAKYRRQIAPFETLMFAASVIGLTLLVTLSGSRQSFAAIALALFIFFLAQRGNFRIGFIRGWALGAAGVWLLMMTFGVAAPLRHYLDEQGGLGDQSMEVMLEGARTAFDPTGLLVNGAMVSKRISGGLDGMLAVNLSQPQIVRDAFGFRRTVQVVVAKLTPRTGATEEMVTGKAIAVAYAGKSMEDRIASAVGMFAALQLTFGRGSFFAAFVLGLLGAAYFTFTERLRDPDLTFLLHFIGVQQVVLWILSGNFDIVIPAAIRNLAYVGVFGVMAVVMATAARARRPGADGAEESARPLPAPAA